MLRHILFSAALAIQIAPSPGSAGGMTFAHPYPEESSFDIWARELAGCVENEIGIFVEVIGGGRLGRSEELAKSVLAGAIDAAILPAVAFAGI